MSVEWSNKGEKTVLVAADELLLIDSEDGNNATKNKRASISNLSSIIGSTPRRAVKTTNSDTTTNIQDPATFVIIPLTGNVEFIDPEFTVVGNGIQCNFTGRVRVTAQINNKTNTSSQMRMSGLYQITNSRTGEYPNGILWYNRNIDGTEPTQESGATISTVVDVINGDILSILNTQINGDDPIAGNTVTLFSAFTSSLELEFLPFVLGQPISSLPDGEATRLSTDVIAYEDATGGTFKGSIRPNPPRQINVKSQAQLEIELGTNIEIPDGEKITIVVDESFTLDKPFLIGAGSVLEMYASTIEGTITYTGTVTMFQQLGGDIRALLLHDMFITTGTFVPFCDLKGTSRCFIEEIRVEGFKGAETEFPVTKFDNLAAVNWIIGWVIKNPVSFNSSNTNLRQSTAEDITFISIITNIISRVVISDNPVSALQSTDSRLFFDPNAPAGTSFIIKDTTISGGNFYQKGVDNSIFIILDHGSGQIELQTVLSNTFHIGQLVVLSGFTESTYNGTFRILEASATDFVVQIPFVSTDTGLSSIDSLNEKSSLVEARNNPGQPDSMNQAEARTTTSVNLIPTSGSFTSLNDDTPAPNDFIEDPATRRFSVNDETGVVTYIGASPIESTDITFDVRIQKTAGGGTDTAVISLFIMDIKQDKTDRTTLPYSSSIPANISYTGGLFTINPGDTFELKIDATSVDPITAITKIVIRD